MKSIAVIGCGRFGKSVAKTISESGREVLAVDVDENRVQDISPFVTHAVQADVMDETVLLSLGLGNFDAAVIAIGSDLESSIMATLIAKEAGVPLVVAKAQSILHGKILLKTGADKVIYPERDMGIRVAHNLISQNILDFIELSPEFSVIELTAFKRWVGKMLSELRLPNKYGLSIVAIKRDEQVLITPKAQETIETNDTLVIIGNNKDIRNLEKRQSLDDN